MSNKTLSTIPIFEEIFSFKNLLKSFQEFEKGKKYKPDVAEFKSRLVENIYLLHSDILFGNYKHGGYLHFKVSDPKPRDIHKATVRDRVVHHAIYRALYPYFNSKFIFDSYSCRVGKGTHKAINRFEEFGRRESKNYTNTVWILKCDIRKCFASVDHQVLKDILSLHIFCGNTMRVLNSVIDSFCSSGFGKGIPLGNLTSQLFINIYLHKLDFWMKRQEKIEKYIRYADDFVIFSNDMEALNLLRSKIGDFLEKELKLEVHPNKVFIKTLNSGVDFLGWVHFPKHRVLRTKTKRRIFTKLKNNPTKPILASYFGLLKWGNTYYIKKMLNMV